MAGSKYFGDQIAKRPNVLAGGGRGAEIRDLRRDVETGFARVEEEFTDRWDDVQGPIATGTAQAALTFEAYRDTSLKLYFWAHNQNDELHFTYQMPHRWNRTDVRPHLHVVPMANAAGDVVVDGHYTWVNVGEVLPALASWTTFKVVTSFVAADQYKEKIISLGLITPPTPKESALLLIYLRRPGLADPDDTYSTNKDHGTVSANLGLLSSDVHYQSEKLGSVVEFPV